MQTMTRNARIDFDDVSHYAVKYSRCSFGSIATKRRRAPASFPLVSRATTSRIRVSAQAT